MATNHDDGEAWFLQQLGVREAEAAPAHDLTLCPAHDPYPTWAPLVTSPPNDHDPLVAYNEDEVVSLIHQIYRVLLKLRYLKPSDVIFPPKGTGRHPGINRARFSEELNISPEVISLVECLPYPNALSSGSRMDRWCLFPEAIAANYLNEAELRKTRDPHVMNRLARSHNPEPDVKYLLPHDIALLLPYESEGLCWILDVKASGLCYLSIPLVCHDIQKMT